MKNMAKYINSKYPMNEDDAEKRSQNVKTLINSHHLVSIIFLEKMLQFFCNYINILYIKTL